MSAPFRIEPGGKRPISVGDRACCKGLGIFRAHHIDDVAPEEIPLLEDE
jgi:hypothetical protein